MFGIDTKIFKQSIYNPKHSQYFVLSILVQIWITKTTLFIACQLIWVQAVSG